MRVTQLFLSETPIEDVNLVGNWERNSSFRRPMDRKLLTSPKGQAKLIHKWQRTVVPFSLWFVNSPEAGRHKEVGEVTEQWLATNLPTTLPQLQLRDNAVNVIYTNNSGAEWMPMTAWVAAHRFAHVIRALPEFEQMRDMVFRALTRILVNAYGQTQPQRYDFERREVFNRMMTKFCEMIGTFKSARNKQIRNQYEFVYELVAQYMITGTIRFNPVPRSFSHGRMAWGRPTNYASLRGSETGDDINQDLMELAAQTQNACEDLLYSCVGRIFVM